MRNSMQNPSKKSLARQFIALATPTLLSGIVYTLYTLVDAIFIGRYLGTKALAALNLSIPLIYLPYALSLMIGVGGSTLNARLAGQGRNDEARRVFTQALWAMLAIGVALSLPVLTLAPQIAHMLGAGGELAALMQTYLKAYGCFILFAQAFYALDLSLLDEGARAATFGPYAMLLGAAVNVALNYCLIVVWPLGMTGAGMATGISMLASSAAMIAYCRFKACIIKPCRRSIGERRSERGGDAGVCQAADVPVPAGGRRSLGHIDAGGAVVCIGVPAGGRQSACRGLSDGSGAPRCIRHHCRLAQLNSAVGRVVAA
jgi:Na+-driven multidrug efflux pump